MLWEERSKLVYSYCSALWFTLENEIFDSDYAFKFHALCKGLDVVTDSYQ
jgi:hypothetical protein